VTAATAADRVRPLVEAMARDLPAGSSLLDWDVDHGLSLTIVSGDQHLLVELSLRDDAVECWARTARFNLTARDPFKEGSTLGPRERAVLDALVRALEIAERSLDVVPRQDAGAVKVRSVAPARALVREGRGQYYLNPYVGCTIGCSFCFVERQADLSRALEGLPRLPWGRFVDVKAELPRVLREETRRLPPGIVRLSPIVTDPYQPLERKHRVTRGCLEALLDAGFSPCVLTRAALVTEDVPLLARFERAWVGLSIPTDDDRVRQAFEPGADPLDARFEALAACRAAGLRTFAVIQPMLPMDAARLVTRLAPLVEVVRVDQLHVAERVAHVYAELGREDALEPAWAERTRRALVEGFASRGVQLHALDDLGELFARPGPSG
jgi:DNA repair photolyase